MPETTSKLKIPLPTGNENVLRVHHREQLSAIEENAALDPFIIRSMEYDSLNDRITLTIGPGIAELYNGDAQVLVQKDTDTTYYINAPTANTTYYVFLQHDGTITHNTTGVVPAGAILLWQVATGATVSTLTKTDRRAQISGVGVKVAAHLADTTTMHGATSAATADRLILRDAAGRAKVAAPSAADDIARKDTVDVVQANLDTHSALKAAAGILGHIRIGTGLSIDVDGIVSAGAFKIGSFTRDTSLPSGTQAVTGVGFTPRIVLLLANIHNTASASIGIDNVTNAHMIINYHLATANAWSYAIANSVNLVQGPASGYYGRISSFDPDGFTFSWTQLGTTSGTAAVIYLAIK